MDETLLKIRVLTRAEMTLAKANARRIAARSRLYAVALGMVLLTVVMINIAAYEYLSTLKGNAVAALLVALANAVLAMVVIFAASRIKPGPEEEMVREIRELALTELSADADGLKRNFAQISSDIERIRSGFSSVSGAFGSAHEDKRTPSEGKQRVNDGRQGQDNKRSTVRAATSIPAICIPNVLTRNIFGRQCRTTATHEYAFGLQSIMTQPMSRG